MMLRSTKHLDWDIDFRDITLGHSHRIFHAFIFLNTSHALLRPLTYVHQVWTLAWDPEVQTISILADEPLQEIFNITTSSIVDALPEVQLVTVSYDDIDEVQTITTSQVIVD